MKLKVNSKNVKKLLSSTDRKKIEKIIRSDSNARTIRRALILKMMDCGYSEKSIEQLAIGSDRTVRNIRKRYKKEGLPGSLYDKERSGKPAVLTVRQSQRIVAMACATPPEGYSRWTLDLLCEESKKAGIVLTVSRESIRIILQNHDLKPWQKKMWCIPKLDQEYIDRMEDVLAVYEKPLDPKAPVVCMDEKPVQLLEHKREPEPMRPGKPGRQDYEYKRNGSVNVFRAVEPKAGRHFTKVTQTRKKPEFAAFLKTIANKYPDADTIHLVMDNLSSHRETALIETFGAEEGHRIWSRFTVHYTPKHASWLNQAEIGIGIYARQCIGKERVSSIDELKERSTAWNRSANRKKIKINWTFTRKKARQKFGYKSGKD
jgi:transposase